MARAGVVSQVRLEAEGFSVKVEAFIAQQGLVNSPGLRERADFGAHDRGIGQQTEQPQLGLAADDQGELILLFEPGQGRRMMNVTVIAGSQQEVDIAQAGHQSGPEGTAFTFSGAPLGYSCQTR